MSFTRFNIPKDYWYIIATAPELKGFSTKYKLADLLGESKFYIVPSGFMGGITFHKSAILLHKNFKLFTVNRQLQILAHEGVHVAQQKAWGWISFMWKYVREWVKCGFSYSKMKLIGIEKAAYDYQKLFASYL